MYRNKEGYSDPTAGKALANILKEEKKQKKAEKAIKIMNILDAVDILKESGILGDIIE